LATLERSAPENSPKLKKKPSFLSKTTSSRKTDKRPKPRNKKFGEVEFGSDTYTEFQEFLKSSQAFAYLEVYNLVKYSKNLSKDTWDIISAKYLDNWNGDVPPLIKLEKLHIKKNHVYMMLPCHEWVHKPSKWK